MLFGAEKLAELLGIAESQARRIMAREDFKVTVISPRRYRIRREDFLDWLERQAV
ncbi:helix-turn-helix domain-containing protein [Alicyclobacillus sp. SO9]|uniref:helix-turn-helix domain-containing protein n=1 Tax=Alicyclobacillus sp. SO9 TaxID=2665646 RepID=UPI0018E896BC|nr:helix-turn-helix domain-containing protein [Alicyclobacillus sp. SO9]QQE78089.1 helix-turn-helix domain-containing protein [Alicyclobacillus sp. SO9]